MYCTAIDGAGNEPVVENTVHKLADIIEVDCNENKQYVVSVHADNTATVIVNANASDDDHKSHCTDELTSNSEASSQINHPVNTSGVIFSCQMDSVELNETLSDTCVSQNASIDPLHNLHNTSIRLCDSFCGSDSDPVSQSQGPQLTNTEKVRIFAMELDMMKVPVSAHDSEHSVFDSLTDVSSPIFF